MKLEIKQESSWTKTTTQPFTMRENPLVVVECRQIGLCSCQKGFKIQKNNIKDKIISYSGFTLFQKKNLQNVEYFY